MSLNVHNCSNSLTINLDGQFVSQLLPIHVSLHLLCDFVWCTVDVLELLDRETASKAIASFQYTMHHRDFVMKGKNNCIYLSVHTLQYMQC